MDPGWTDVRDGDIEKLKIENREIREILSLNVTFNLL
jgi:hypothetical protein